MAALDVAKGAFMDDDDGMVATWWRPSEPCMCRGLSLLLVLLAALVAWPGWRPPGAPWSCELNAGARSPWDLLRAGACAWWLSCCRPPESLDAPQEHPWRSVPLRWASWSTLGAKRCPFSGLGDRTPYAPRRRGGPTSGGVPFRIIKSFFRAVFCVTPSSIGTVSPRLGNPQNQVS